MRDDEELLRHFSQKELMLQLMMTQVFLVLLGAGIGSLFIDPFPGHLASQWKFDVWDAFLYGIGPGALILGMDVWVMRVFPEKHIDDGGINRKLFENQHPIIIIIATAIIAFSEEFMFRGVLQPLLGYVTTSLLFALVHLRYLRKPVLFISVLIISFLLGFVYEQTRVLTYVFLIHFLVDVTLAFMIRTPSQ